VLTVLLATFGWVLIGWLPGILVVDCLRPGAGWLRNALLAPMVALGLTMIVAQGLQLLHVRIEPATVLPVSIGLPLVAWAGVMTRRRRRAATGGPSHPDDSDRIRRVDAGLLGFATMLGLFIWWVAIPSISSVLPNNDGTHHGLWASRILHLGTLDLNRVLPGDVTTYNPPAHYYPLAVHVATALISGVTGAPVSAVLTVGFVLASCVLLPFGMFVLTRRLLPQMPAAAPIAAVLATALPWFPYAVVLWGQVPVIIAMSLVPAGIDAVWRRHGDGGALPVGLALGLAGYGVFTAHNTELVTIGLYGFVLAFAGRSDGAPDQRRRLLATWTVGIGVFGILVAPQIPRLIAGAGDAATYAGNATTASSSGSHDPGWVLALAVVNPLVLAFSVAGLVITLSRRWCFKWTWCLAITLALCASTAIAMPALSALTAPWYSSWIRISYMFSYFEAVYGAVGLLVFVRWIIAAVQRRQADRPRPAMVAGAVLVGIFAAAIVLAESIGLAAAGYRSNSLIGPDQRAGFEWLAAHVVPGGRVLNDFSDGSGWMATLDGVTPVFGIKPDPPSLDPQAIWGDRWYLLTHAGSLSSDPRARAAVGRWAVGYVYVNDRSFGDVHRGLSSAALSRSSAYHEVWHRGTVTIFSVVAS
jgi:hypothetical protein